MLRDNYEQATALGNARAQARALLPVHRRLITELERSGRLDRAIEAMPTDEELAARFAAGGGLTSPEFAVLMAYVKIALEAEMHGSELPDEEWTHPVLVDYFPTRAAQPLPGVDGRAPAAPGDHHHPAGQRGGQPGRYQLRVPGGGGDRGVAGRRDPGVRHRPGRLRPGRLLGPRWRRWTRSWPPTRQTDLYLAVRRLLDRAVRWLVTNRRPPLDVTAEIARLRPGVAKLLPRLDSLLRGDEAAALGQQRDRLVAAGAPDDLALDAARLVYAFGLLDVVACAEGTGRDVQEVAGVYFVLSERFQVDALLTKISALPRDDRWQTLARMSLRYDLYASLASLTREVLNASPQGEPDDRVVHWEQTNATAIAQSRNAIGEFGDSPGDLAALSVLLRQIRTLVSASAS